MVNEKKKANSNRKEKSKQQQQKCNKLHLHLHVLNKEAVWTEPFSTVAALSDSFFLRHRVKKNPSSLQLTIWSLDLTFGTQKVIINFLPYYLSK